MKVRTNIRLDEQARADAALLVARHNLGSVSAAVRFALREVARAIEEKEKEQDHAQASH
jgi:Arc/MetJ-type ribon-helix-helix transcriptional regulator